MKTLQGEAAAVTAAGMNGIRRACRECYETLRERLARVKEAIFAESAETMGSQERLVRLALNEAEAAAWQTLYPHLVFPALAAEKVQAVAAWSARQREVRRSGLTAAVMA